MQHEKGAAPLSQSFFRNTLSEKEFPKSQKTTALNFSPNKVKENERNRFKIRSTQNIIVIKDKQKGFIDFKRQKDRPDITQMNAVNPHQNRYQYLYQEPSISTANKKCPNISIGKTCGRINKFKEMKKLKEMNAISPGSYNKTQGGLNKVKGAVSFDKMRSWDQITKNQIVPDNYLVIQPYANEQSSFTNSKRRNSMFHHSSARIQKDRRLPIFMQNNFNRMGNDSLSNQKLKNTYFFTSTHMQIPQFAKESTNFLKWKDLQPKGIAKQPLRLAREYLTQFIQGGSTASEKESKSNNNNNNNNNNNITGISSFSSSKKQRKCLGNDNWSRIKISRPSVGGVPESFDMKQKL